MKDLRTTSERIHHQVQVVKEMDGIPSISVQMDLEEQRKHVEEQTETENYWAGRNLAGRISARRAA